jgi:hypothetical protein
VVTLRSPEDQDFCGKPLDEAPACGVLPLMAPELGGLDLSVVSSRTHAHYCFMIDFMSYNHFAPVWSVQMTRASHQGVAPTSTLDPVEEAVPSDHPSLTDIVQRLEAIEQHLAVLATYPPHAAPCTQEVREIRLLLAALRLPPGPDDARGVGVRTS